MFINHTTTAAKRITFHCTTYFFAVCSLLSSSLPFLSVCESCVVVIILFASQNKKKTTTEEIEGVKKYNNIFPYSGLQILTIENIFPKIAFIFETQNFHKNESNATTFWVFRFFFSFHFHYFFSFLILKNCLRLVRLYLLIVLMFPFFSFLILMGHSHSHIYDVSALY